MTGKLGFVEIIRKVSVGRGILDAPHSRQLRIRRKPMWKRTYYRRRVWEAAPYEEIVQLAKLQFAS